MDGLTGETYTFGRVRDANLEFVGYGISKLLERLVTKQLTDYLRSLQSEFRPVHSMETAVLRELSNILGPSTLDDVASLVLRSGPISCRVQTSAGVPWTGWSCAGVAPVLYVGL